MDIRQSPQWGNYLSSIGWVVEKIGESQAFVRPIPLLGRSIIKIQHPQNPLSFLEIDQIAKKHKALFVIIEPESPGFDEKQLIQAGFIKSNTTLTHTLTIYIDLQKSEEKILASFSENARRNIKKALNNNLEIKKVFLKDVKNDKDFKNFYDLFFNLRKIKKFYAPGYNEFHKKMQAFKNSSVLLFAYYQNQPIAVVWLGLLKNTAVYMNTGITTKGYKFLANYLLVWEVIKLAKSLGLQTFDLEGLYDPRFPKERKSWVKFSEFKRRFHGKLVEYPCPWIKIYSKFYKLIYLCSKIFPN